MVIDRRKLFVQKMIQNMAGKDDVAKSLWLAEVPQDVRVSISAMRIAQANRSANGK